jgi:hypothetical protein
MFFSRFKQVLPALFLCALSLAPALGAPVNDAFLARLAVTGFPATVTGNNTDATAQSGEPAHAGQDATSSVWWSWRAPANAQVEINTFGSAFDTILAVYVGSSLGGLSVVAANDDAGDVFQSRVRFAAQANVDYKIAVDGYLGEQGSIRLNIVAPPQAPPNDHFVDAIALAGFPVSAVGSNVAATAEAGEPAHAFDPADASVWWSWTAPATGRVQIDTYGSGFDTVLGVYTGAAVNSLTEIASNDDAGSGQQSKVIFLALSNATYRIAVDGLVFEEGRISLHVLSAPAPPPNDAFSGRIAVAGLPATAHGSNIAATAEAGEPPHANEPADASVWWSWTAPASGRVEINTFGSGFDTVLAVYTGAAMGALTTIAANNNDGAGLQSRTTFSAQAGVAYAIAVDGMEQADGDIELSILPSAGPPLNDAFSNRTVLVGMPAGDTGNNEAATPEIGEPPHMGFPAVASLWWTWTAPVTAMIYVDSTRSQNETRLGVYTGSSLFTLAQVDGVVWRGRLRFVAQQGVAYQVAVDSFPGLEGDIALDVYAVSSPVVSGLEPPSSNALRIGWTGHAGEIYDVSSSTNLVPPSWRVETSEVASADAAFVDLPADPDATSRFYRVDMQAAPP